MAAIRPLPQGAPAPLAIAYRDAPPAQVLAQPGTLAVVRFGDDAATHPDPRVVSVPLQPLAGGAARCEAWQVDAEVAHGRDDGIAWAQGGGYLMAQTVVDEAAAGDIAAASERAYRGLLGFIHARGHTHLLRAWNYLADINQGDGDAERYRHFSAGRARGLAGLPAGDFPAATAIGRTDGGRQLLVYVLAATRPGTPVENPRQVSAYRYPRQYGPVPPSFARAMQVASQPPLLLISGTASVVGHASQHAAVDAQVAETLRNLDSLGEAAGFGASLPRAGSCLKVYVRDAAEAPAIAAQLAAAGFAADRVLLLAGDICRAELLVEIDGACHG